MKYAPLISSEYFEEKKILKNYHKADIGFGFDLHEHNYEHTIVCTKGLIKITIDEIDTFVDPNYGIFTFPAKIPHKVEVMENDTSFYTEHFIV